MQTDTPLALALTRRQVAAALNCSEKTVSRMVAAGALKETRLAPQTIRFRVADVAAALERLATPAEGAD